MSTKQEDHLKFLFEYNDEFAALPTYAVIVAMNASAGLFTGAIPGLSVDVTKVSHIYM